MQFDPELNWSPGLVARFDDLTPEGNTWGFSDPERVLVAHQSADLSRVLEAVAEATTDRWAAGYVAYEAAPGLNPALVTHPVAGANGNPLPLAWFAIFDSPHQLEPLDEGTPRGFPYRVSGWQLAPEESAYSAKVDRIRGLIREGETYQCNLTLPLRTTVSGSLVDLYHDLALAQRGAYNAYLDTGSHVIVSASPELFFDWTGDEITARPMKGTSTRGRWPREDRDRADDLLRSAKDRAENMMIVDLLRNDLGKIAQPGSVRTRDLCQLERFETVWQLTSTVAARLSPGINLVEIFRALFPCGSVTGAPKARTMALIKGLEEVPRGVYCGAVGMVAPPGSAFRARFNVAIRTVVVDQHSGEATYGTGGAITWDSRAESEHQELIAKSAILHTAREPFQLLETMAYRPGAGLHNRTGHLQRLAASASYFGFKFDPGELETRISAELAGLNQPARVRLLLDRRGRISVELSPLPGPAQARLRLALDREPVLSSSIWLFHKTTNRRAYQSRAGRHPDADDVVLVNERGELTEATVANLAVRLDDKWFTPSLECGCLPGVERQRLLEAGQLREGVILIEDLERAQGLALVSSLRGWRSAGLLERETPSLDRELSQGAGPATAVPSQASATRSPRLGPPPARDALAMADLPEPPPRETPRLPRRGG
ncbi:MAG TPA: aminodeoxychorismate synthase component I [Candidatus Dormibacteraeota bacterium]